ncbi:hypothetical protein DL96DRAFT_1597550 [Flagelloscypha sp. PMI_526]|nr:hypothetical protein DL96DRAFT_1597550 [Flagelloscypha sp. PMI_526]
MKPSDQGSGLKRHVPRRLFSGESSRSGFSGRTRRTASNASSQDADLASNSRQPAVLDGLVESPREFDGSEHWPGVQQFTSSKNDAEPFSQYAESDYSNSSASSSRRTTAHSRSETSPSSSSTSSVSRWGTVRQAVLPDTANEVPPLPSHRKFATSAGHSQTSSSSSSVTSTPSSSFKAQAPKSRFAAKLGFRQVAEAAREVAIDDGNRFAAEILKACQTAQFVDPFKPRSDTQYLPFMSSTSLPALESLAPNNPRKATADSAPQPTLANRSGPSLKPLYQTLHHWSNLVADGASSTLHLPYESLVLSCLLTPFLSAAQPSSQADEERRFAYEAFDIISLHWKPRDELDGVNRCLWCCQAASSLSSFRSQTIQRLWRLLGDTGSQLPITITTPGPFKTLAHGLYFLQAALQASSNATPGPNDAQDRRIVDDIFRGVVSGSFGGPLEDQAIEEAYNSLIVSQDDSAAIRAAITLQGFVACFSSGLNRTKRTLLRYYLEIHWPIDNGSTYYTPLLCAIQSRILSTFTQTAIDVIPFSNDAAHSYTHIIIRALQNRVLPQLQRLKQDSAPMIERKVVEVVLKTWTLGDEQLEKWATQTLRDWYREKQTWKQRMDEVFVHLVCSLFPLEWARILELLPLVHRHLPDDIRTPLLLLILPPLYDRIVQEPPALPCPKLGSFFAAVSQTHPQIFYKPLFSCAASTKDVTVANHLSVLAGMSRYFEGLWTQNAEMICVALTSDTKSAATVDAAGVGWARARLGQTVLLIEMISQVQGVRHAKERTNTSNDEAIFANQSKFFASLDSKLGILLDAKEKNARLAPSQRLLYLVLFREIRLLTKVTKRPSWLPQTIAWFRDFHVDDEVAEYTTEEIKEAVSQVGALFGAAVDGIQATSHRRSTLALSKTAQTTFMQKDESETGLASFFTRKESLFTSLRRGFARKALKLFVAMAMMLNSNELKKIGPLVWDQHLDEADDPSAIAAASFLMMQCAERVPDDLAALIVVDFRSSDDQTRLSAARRLSTLLNWRYQIGSQQVVVDRTHRIFRMARQPLPFVQTDMGSTEVILEEAMTEEEKVPLELRKRLADIGWADEAKTVDEQLHRIQTPMTLLPAYQLTTTSDQLLTPQKGATKDTQDIPSLLRRNSSTGGPLYGVKRKSIFVPALASLLPRLALLAFDKNILIATTVRSILMDLLRNDPALLTRPAHEKLAGDSKDLPLAMSAFRAILHIRRAIPPHAGHDMFNYLGGFLKYESRLSDPHIDSLSDFSHVMPVLAGLAFPCWRDVNARIQKGQTRSYLPSFRLAVLHVPSTSDASGVEAPRSYRLSRSRPEWGNRLLLSRDFTPSQPSSRKPIQEDLTLVAVSLVLSRSYLILVSQIFRSMSRHLNDKEELAILVDGINRILLVHGNDIGIVSQSLVAFMIASVRFRRLFTSGGSYALFMPAVLKVYAEAQPSSGIRLAIEYASVRFYALHRDAFIFQTLDILAETFSAPEGDSSSPDPAGIHDVNRLEEREALMVLTAEEKPQTLLAALRQGSNGGTQVKTPASLEFPEEYETKKLVFDNMVRLFLTVIAHDHTILRAQNFLRFLRFLSPHLYHASSAARAVLQEGLDALAAILMRAVFTRGKESLPDASSTKAPSDITAMRLDFLFMVASFCHAGGLPSPPTIRQALSILILAHRDSGRDSSREITAILSQLTNSLLLRPEKPPAKYVNYILKDISSAVKSVGSASGVDFTAVFDAVREILQLPQYSRDASFASTVSKSLCTAAFHACEGAAIDLSLPSIPWRKSFVKLIAQAIDLTGGSVLTALEECRPSYDFLGCIVLPLTLELSTGQELKASIQPLTSATRTSVAASWIRILSYAMTAVNSERGLVQNRKEKSPDRRRGEPGANPAKLEGSTTVIALQVIKAVVIRGETDLTEYADGVWVRLAAFLRQALDKGSADFAISSDRTPSASPMHSPRASGQFNLSSSDPFPPSPLAPSFKFRRGSRSPSLVDYSLWSWLALLTVYRNPLALHMRLLIQEKLGALNEDLQISQETLLSASFSSRSSFGPPRATSTIFSKPRRRLSGLPSPNASPHLSPSNYTTPRHSMEFGFAPDLRQAGWAAATFNSPSKSPAAGPKITHLGPTHLNIHKNGTQGSQDSQATLSDQTYDRIRTILLPLPDGTRDATDENALEQVLDETREMGFGLGDESLQYISGDGDTSYFATS